MRDKSLALIGCITFAVTVFTGGAALGGRENELLAELERLRDDVRGKVVEQIASARRIEEPTVFALMFERGFGRRPMRLQLERRAGEWQPVRIISASLPADTVKSHAAELTWDGDSISGRLIFEWSTGQADAENEAEGEPVDVETEGLQRQIFNINAVRESTATSLIIAFHRVFGSESWILRYEPLENGGWRFAGEEQTPRVLNRSGPFERNIPDIIPDADGYFESVIGLTYKGDAERNIAIYEQGAPVELSFSGRLFDRRIDTGYSFQAPGGKNILSSAHDWCEGYIRDNMIRGRFHAEGSAGEWLGAVDGPWIPAASGLDPVDVLEGAVSGADVTVCAAAVYRQILALARLNGDAGLSAADAVNRTHVAAPQWPEDAAVTDRLQYLEQMLVQARAAIEFRHEEAETKELSVRDEWFGPYYAAKPLPAGNQVPTAGQSGWFVVDEWVFTGPFGVPDHSVPVYYPGVFPVRSAGWQRERIFDDSSSDRRGVVELIEDSAGWTELQLEQNRVMPPATQQASSGAMRYFCWYAATVITSAEKRSVWLAIELEGQAQLWVNEELVWNSGVDWARLAPALLQIDLREGENAVLLRVASTDVSNDHFNRLHWFDGYASRPLGRSEFTSAAVYLGNAVEPRNERNAVKAVMQDVAAAGFRNDGSGIYPDTNPPLAWDLIRGINVKWQQPVPHGQTAPVVAGERLLLACEPHTLLSLDAESGAEIWRRHADVLALHDDVPDVPNADGDVLTAYRAMHRRVSELRAELRGAKGIQAEALRKQIDQARHGWEALDLWLKSKGIGLGDTAWASPVVADGRVWVYFGTGVAACYDIDSGEPVWIRDTGYRWTQPNMGSPVLADGLLILQTHLGREPEDQFGLLALDAADGEARWKARGAVKRVRVSADRSAGLGNGLAVLTLEHAGVRRTLVITGDGAVVDAADGSIVFRDILRIEANRAAPYVRGDTVFFTPPLGTEAVRFGLDEQGRVLVRTLYSERQRVGRGQSKTITQWGARHWLQGPLEYGGRLFVSRVDTGHVPQHWPTPWHEVSVYDAGHGARLQRIRGVMRECTDPTIAPVKAGGFVITSEGGAPLPGFHGTTEYGEVAFLSASDPSVLLTRSRIPPTRAHPVVIGDRMYLRGFGSLACVRVRDAAGTEYQESVLARTVIDEIGPRPEQREVNRVDAFTGGTEFAEDSIAPIRHRSMPRRWLMAGPYPLADVRDTVPEAEIINTAWYNGMPLEAGGHKRSVRTVDEKGFLGEGNSALSVMAAASNRPNSVVYFYTTLESTETATYSFRCRGSGYRVWIGGREIGDRDLVYLPLGHYPMVMRVEVGRVPPFAANVAVEPSFWRVEDPAAEYAGWVQRLHNYRELIERIIQKRPESPEARTAQTFLEHIKH